MFHIPIQFRIMVDHLLTAKGLGKKPPLSPPVSLGHDILHQRVTLFQKQLLP